MQRSLTIPLIGGLDLITPAVSKPPGTCIAAKNHESQPSGYRRVGGFERLDGRPKPSLASYTLVTFDNGSTAISAGDVVTGATSGATGTVIQDATVDSGTWGGGDAAGEFALYNWTGTFTNGENLQVSAVTRATASADSVENGASTDTLHSTYLRAAIAALRSDIAAVPGSGSVLGVATLSGTVYAWRNNAGGTAAVMHKATTAGWVAQTFGDTLNFTAGTAAFSEGDTVTGGISGATATVERVVLTSGAWDGSGAGYLVLSGTTGTFQAETITSAGGSATGSGAQSAITLAAGGRYRAKEHNFYGASNLVRLYVANGTGRAFEWDGSVMAPINTGLSDALDKPKFVGIISNHLALGFDGGQVSISSTGEPLHFLAATGAATFGIGQDITGMASSTMTALVITGANKISYLGGHDSADFVLDDVSEDSGAVMDSLAVVGMPLFLDKVGVRDLKAADSYGNWRIGSTSQAVTPWFKSQTAAGASVVGAMRVRDRDLYRLFYDDGSVLSIYFGRKQPESMVLELGITPTCLWSGDDSSGEEVLLIGADDGFVYQMDKGTSFDGSEIEAWLRLAYLNLGTPGRIKRYHRARIEAETAGPDTVISTNFEFGYGDPDQPSGDETSHTMSGGGGYWDTSNWDQFFWDSPDQASAHCEMDGLGENVSPVLISELTHEAPYTMTSITINYTLRRPLR